MEKELSFSNIPFVPVKGQAIYVESSYNKKLNHFIRNNYEWVIQTFLSQGFDFCYLPIIAKEAVCYNAPYLSEDERKNKVTKIPSLVDFIAKDSIIEPSIVFALDIPVKDDDGNAVLQLVTITTKWFVPLKRTFNNIAKEVKRVAIRQSRHYHKLESIRVEKNDCELIDHSRKEYTRFSIAPPEESDESYKDKDYADRNFDQQSQTLIKEIKERINALRNRGVNTMFLHDIIDAGEQLSRLRITKDFRLFLEDYDNMEIKLAVLPKSVFLLFLRHPEGIRFKELSDYYSELLQIYLKMNPIGGRSKQEQSIQEITNPCSNSINEKCARIREAFVANFDDRLARNYYITGKRGEAKRIMLDESMIIWD